MYNEFAGKLAKKPRLKSYPMNINYLGQPFHLHVVFRHPKYTIAQANNPDIISKHTKKENATSRVIIKPEEVDQGFFVAYPTNPSHSQLFANSKTQDGGPNYFFPGSAALMRYSTIRALGQFHIEYIQFSFRQGQPEAINRSMASKYQGVRRRLVEAGLDYMVENNLSELFRGYAVERSRRNHNAIDEILLDERFLHITENKR